MMAKVNGKVVRVMLDTGAINNFVSFKMVDQLGLKVTKSTSQVKVVNLKAQGIQGTTIFTLRVGSWQEECHFMALSLDDFDMILGIEFFV